MCPRLSPAEKLHAQSGRSWVGCDLEMAPREEFQPTVFSCLLEPLGASVTPGTSGC